MLVKRLLARWVVAVLVLAIGFVCVDLFLRKRPELLPLWYRESFPFHAVELFEPGILERTPIEGVPVPIPIGAHTGTPPADLVEEGLAPDALEDRQRFPDLFLPADADGFPNPERLERADVLLVGDSFGVSAGVERPLGLRRRLAEATGRSVYNLSVAAIGPIHEEWLLREIGLAKEPDVVIWLFYAGNDVTYSAEPAYYRHLGHTTYAEAYAERRVPRWIFFDVVRKMLARDGEPKGDPLPGFAFPRHDGSVAPIWFHPDNLNQLGYSREIWQTSIGWKTAADALAAAADACAERGVRFLLVYLPSKAEVYLPHVDADAELLRRTVARSTDPELSAEELLEHLLANRGTLEEVVQAFCDERGIAYLSAVPFLEAQAGEGRLGYLASDTHWQPDGQAVLVEPLAAFVDGEE